MSLGSRLSGGSQASAPPPVAQVDALAVGACVLAPYHGEYYEATIEALLTQQRAVVKRVSLGDALPHRVGTRRPALRDALEQLAHAHKVLVEDLDDHWLREGHAELGVELEALVPLRVEGLLSRP